MSRFDMQPPPSPTGKLTILNITGINRIFQSR
ncbi:unnamed protein product [Trichobilharzia regenti]|nr:unnamed protein product [Trichobilharzia regenti]